MWSLPSRTLARWDVEEIHSVNLLKTLAATLNQEEVDGECGSKVTAGKDVAVSKTNPIGDEWGKESQVKVPELFRVY